MGSLFLVVFIFFSSLSFFLWLKSAHLRGILYDWISAFFSKKFPLLLGNFVFFLLYSLVPWALVVFVCDECEDFHEKQQMNDQFKTIDSKNLYTHFYGVWDRPLYYGEDATNHSWMVNSHRNDGRSIHILPLSISVL